MITTTCSPCLSVPESLSVSIGFAGITMPWWSYNSDPVYRPENFYKDSSLFYYPTGTAPAYLSGTPSTSVGTWFSAAPWLSYFGPTISYSQAYRLNCTGASWTISILDNSTGPWSSSGPNLFRFNVAGAGATGPNFCSPFLMACGIFPTGGVWGPGFTPTCKNWWTVS